VYIPRENRLEDRKRILSFMHEYPFATLISTAGDRPEATHLPFVIKERDDKVILVSHMAKPNAQWKHFDNEVLVVFQEPHAYISPSHYEHAQNVPTWNYAAVHAYGKPHIFTEEQEVRSVLEEMIHFYEAEYYTQWNTLDPKYTSGLMKGIVAFEIEVTELQAKFKMSQNKTPIERENIINALEHHPDSTIRGVADIMKEIYRK